MSLPKVEVKSGMLYRMLFASVKSNLLTTSIRLGIYGHLASPKSAGRLSEILESDPVNTEYFLNGLAACGLLEKKEGQYRNAPVAREFLTKGKPTYLGEGFLMYSGMRDMMTKNLHQAVMQGPGHADPDAFGHSEEKWGRMARLMANNARSGIAQQMSGLVAELPEFASFGKMLDLGAGPGIFCIAIVDKHPAMKGVVFDRRPSTEAAKKFISEYGMEGRIEVMPGDYNQDPIGGGYDLIWASSTLNFAQPNLEAVIKKVYEALNHNGVFIHLGEGLTDESTQPEYNVLCTMAWSMHNHPLKAFDQGVIADHMLKAGFRSVSSRTLGTDWGAMDMDIARK